MSLNKQNGNMYDWITHTHNHLGGACPHKCVYCSIQDLQKRYKDTMPYSGELRLREKQFNDNYGSGKTIFIENCNDLFAEDVPDEWIERILNHCNEFPDNRYVFQTKNPAKMFACFGEMVFPPTRILGCTVETNRENDIGNAPDRLFRIIEMGKFSDICETTFITIEPIMRFDLVKFATFLRLANPTFINIGADSKNHGLPEPIMGEVMALYDRLVENGIEVRKKVNLERLETTND